MSFQPPHSSIDIDLSTGWDDNGWGSVANDLDWAASILSLSAGANSTSSRDGSLFTDTSGCSGYFDSFSLEQWRDAAPSNPMERFLNGEKPSASGHIPSYISIILTEIDTIFTPRNLSQVKQVLPGMESSHGISAPSELGVYSPSRGPQFDSSGPPKKRRRDSNNTAGSIDKPSKKKVDRGPQFNSSGPSKKRRGDSNNTAGSIDKPSKKKVDRGESLRPFGCPFSKSNHANHQQYRSCQASGFKTVHRMKQHLFKCHEPSESRRLRCFEHFENKTQLSDHARYRQCSSKKAPNEMDLIEKEKFAKIKKRSKHGLSEHARWIEIYLILFPHTAESAVPSPYVEVIHEKGNPPKKEKCSSRGCRLLDDQEYLELVIRRKWPTLVENALKRQQSSSNSSSEELQSSRIVEATIPALKELIAQLKEDSREPQTPSHTTYIGSPKTANLEDIDSRRKHSKSFKEPLISFDCAEAHHLSTGVTHHPPAPTSLGKPLNTGSYMPDMNIPPNSDNFDGSFNCYFQNQFYEFQNQFYDSQNQFYDLKYKAMPSTPTQEEFLGLSIEEDLLDPSMNQPFSFDFNRGIEPLADHNVAGAQIPYMHAHGSIQGSFMDNVRSWEATDAAETRDYYDQNPGFHSWQSTVYKSITPEFLATNPLSQSHAIGMGVMSGYEIPEARGAEEGSETFMHEGGSA